jgi:hypothetical protein
MIKHLALLTLIATPFLAHAQVDEDAAVAAAKAPAVPLVTYDITGTFPANAPTTRMTAPDAAFYLEFSVPQTIPANPSNQPENFGCLAYNVTFVFEGQVYHPAGNYNRADSGGNLESLGFHTRFGWIGLGTSPGYHTPNLALRVYNPGLLNPEVAVFASGDLGVGTGWYFFFTPKGTTTPYIVTVNLTDLVGRVVVPQSRPLATR